MGFNLLKKVSALLQLFKRKEKREIIRVKVVEPEKPAGHPKLASSKITITRVSFRHRTLKIKKKPPPKISSKTKGLKDPPHFMKQLWNHKGPVEAEED